MSPASTSRVGPEQEVSAPIESMPTAGARLLAGRCRRTYLSDGAGGTVHDVPLGIDVLEGGC